MEMKNSRIDKRGKRERSSRMESRRKRSVERRRKRSDGKE